jgi:CBS domain-containing protein
MNISQCMSTDVRICAPGDAIRDAARVMKEIDAGALPVGENDRLVGMITDRDIAIRAVARDCGPQTPVGEVMTGDLEYCFEDDDIDGVASKMARAQVKRLPVLNRQKRLVGVVALSDLSRAEGAPSGPTAAALSGISQPGGRHVQ